MAAGIKPAPVEPQRQYENSIRYYHARLTYQSLDDEYYRNRDVSWSYDVRSMQWHDLQAARFEYRQALYAIQFPQFA